MSGENYILFLKLKRELPECFYHFSEHFSKLNISLIPVDPEELAGLAGGKTQQVMVFIPDLQSLHRFQRIRKRFLDFALFSGKFHLFEVSSFAAIDIASRLKRQNLYRFFQLPISLSEVLRSIALTFYQENRDTQRWPGGRRAKLPVIN